MLRLSLPISAISEAHADTFSTFATAKILSADDLGKEVPNEHAVRHLAVSYVIALAYDVLSTGADRAVSYEVRDIFGREVFKVALSFACSGTLSVFRRADEAVISTSDDPGDDRAAALDRKCCRVFPALQSLVSYG